MLNVENMSDDERFECARYIIKFFKEFMPELIEEIDKAQREIDEAIAEEEAKEEEVTLILALDVGKFPKGRNKPEDFEEYLMQSDHTLDEFEIIKVVQKSDFSDFSKKIAKSS